MLKQQILQANLAKANFRCNPLQSIQYTQWPHSLQMTALFRFDTQAVVHLAYATRALHDRNLTEPVWGGGVWGGRSGNGGLPAAWPALEGLQALAFANWQPCV